jgi:phosphate transport system permease protein
VYTAVVLHTKNLDAFAGALALGCLMLPIVIRTTDEMLRLVPAELREGSVALGSRQARTIVRVVMPAALPGIVSGALLAVARAAGETAPLLFVVGIVTETNRSLFNGSNTTLSLQIFKNANQPFLPAQQRAWAAALTLVGIVFIFTVIARSITALYSRRSTAS